MKKLTVLFLLAVCLGGTTAWGVNKPDSVAPGTKSEPVRIVQLSGDGAEIGKGHGKELSDSIKLLHEKYLKVWFKKEETRKRALMAAFMFRAQLSPEHKAEIGGLAEATGLDPGDVMLGNCFLDLLPMTACSTVTLPASASPDGVARFGRNLDFPALNIADKHSVLMIVKPKDKYAFAAVSWPGLIGVLSGMNEHGLAVANMEVTRPQGLPQAMPYILLYRSVLEQCKTTDEAIEFLKNTPRQTANNLMIMDAAGNRAVAEITPDGVTVRKSAPDAALMSTNHHRGEDADSTGKCDRYDALHAASQAQFGKIGVAEIRAMLDRVSQGKMTLQSMIFEPANRVMYLAVGSEASKRQYERIDLKEYFGK
jgi:isopenicillin-N N-acyltransferase like protein